MNESIQRGLNLLSPGSVVPVDVKTVADLYAALKYTVDQLRELQAQLDDKQDDTCTKCRQGPMMLTGTGYHWFCDICGNREKVEPEEP